MPSRRRLLSAAGMLVFTSVLPARADDPDLLYRERINLDSARGAISIWDARLKTNPRDFESAWKIARATYWLAKHAVADTSRRAFHRGIAAGRRAVQIEPSRPEGYFWMAANMSGLAEFHGIWEGLRYRAPIREALETVLRLDSGFLGGSADTALGRWYHLVPRALGGNEAKSEEYLRKALTYNENSILTRYFLGEILFSNGRKAEAVSEFRKALALSPNPDFDPEDRELQQNAAQRLAHLTRNGGQP